MKFDKYIKQSDRYMHSLYMCMDNAWSAEKMYIWSNLGDDNPAWTTGPYISAGANGIPIERKQPYCLRVSDHTGFLFAYQRNPDQEMSPNGGSPLGHESEIIKANMIIPTVSISMQFAILESFDFDTFHDYKTNQQLPVTDKKTRKYQRKPVSERMDIINELTGGGIGGNVINAYRSVSNYRNKLIHEPKFFCESPNAAIDIYIVCQAIAFSIRNALLGSSELKNLAYRTKIWDARIAAFDSLIEF